MAEKKKKQNCFACGIYVVCETHHIVAIGSGGSDVPHNFVSLCSCCHHIVTRGLLLKNWAPYIGFQFLDTGYYRAAAIYSPILTSSGAISSRTTTPVQSDLTYNLNQPGYLMSVTGEYYLLLSPPATFSLWFSGAISSTKR
ncbi:MAG: HNH endonuclease signature motif containing protein [Pseudomonadota bacterium]